MHSMCVNKIKNGFLEKIETWHAGLSCQYTHFMSFSSKSEHDTVADQATLKIQAHSFDNVDIFDNYTKYSLTWFLSHLIWVPQPRDRVS